MNSSLNSRDLRGVFPRFQCDFEFVGPYGQQTLMHSENAQTTRFSTTAESMTVINWAVWCVHEIYIVQMQNVQF
jgi:hypothetical protein